MPQAGQFNPVKILIGHFGQNQYSEGLYLYSKGRPMITIINRVYLLMYFNLQLRCYCCTIKDDINHLDNEANNNADNTPFLGILCHQSSGFVLLC